MTGNAMGGSGSSSHLDTVTAEEVTMPGRHRARGGPGTDTWTPVVPADSAGHHRHRPGATPPPPRRTAGPAFTPARGTLPVPPAESWLPQPTRMQERGAFEPPRRERIDLPQPSRTRAGTTAAAPADSGFAANSGQLDSAGLAGEPENTWEQSGDLTEPVAAVAGPGRRVANGHAVVPDRRPVSDVDRAWAPPGTTRSLADVHEGREPFGLAAGPAPEEPKPQVRRTRRERVEATTATLAGEAGEAATRNEPPRRQRVTLRAPAVKAPEPEDDEVRVYAAPLLDGLGKFDLGSVPASVTPPKTWRKAAWFATGASGAVVVGLLFAGTFLVGGPTTTTDALGGGWPGRQNGGNPLILDPSLGQHSGTGDSRSDSNSSRPSSDTDSSSAGPDRHPQQAVGTPATDEQSPTDPATGDSSGPVTTGPTSTPAGTPEKPPITPAERETSPTVVIYSTPKDAKKMGDNSEKFFNTVTTDPEEAASVTTGDLKSEGPQRLRQRYADVAYFEVKKVEIDPDNNTTVNTLEVTHTDGTKTVEQRTLTFGDDEKIADDGA